MQSGGRARGQASERASKLESKGRTIPLMQSWKFNVRLHCRLPLRSRGILLSSFLLLLLLLAASSFSLPRLGQGNAFLLLVIRPSSSRLPSFLGRADFFRHPASQTGRSPPARPHAPQPPRRRRVLFVLTRRIMYDPVLFPKRVPRACQATNEHY